MHTKSAKFAVGKHYTKALTRIKISMRIIKGQNNFRTSEVINKNNSQLSQDFGGQALRPRSGQAMVEALVAISIILVGILGVFTLTSSSISINRIDADRYVAINLAKEGIELVKNLLDKNIIDELPWNNLPGFSMDGDYKIDYDDTLLSGWTLSSLLFFSKDSGGYRYPEIGDEETNFNRKITIDNVDDKHIKVTSTVYWASKNIDYEFSAVNYFYDLAEFKWNLLR